MKLNLFLGLFIVFYSIYYAGKKTEAIQCHTRTFPAETETNLTAAVTEIRKAIRAYWSANKYGTLTPSAQKLVDVVQKFAESDSLSLISTLLTFTLSFAVDNILMYRNPGFCARAELINASVQYSESKDGRIIVGAIKTNYDRRYSICTSMVKEALSSTGCKKLPINNMTCYSDCLNEGRVYAIKKALKYYGTLLPCPLPDLLLELYSSSNYIDNMMAVTMVSGLVNGGQVGVGGDLRNSLEILYGYLEPEVKKCCCKSMRQRYVSVCEEIASADFSPIYDRYLSTECPPEELDDEAIITKKANITNTMEIMQKLLDRVKRTVFNNGNQTQPDKRSNSDKYEQVQSVKGTETKIKANFEEVRTPDMTYNNSLSNNNDNHVDSINRTIFIVNTTIGEMKKLIDNIEAVVSGDEIRSKPVTKTEFLIASANTMETNIGPSMGVKSQLPENHKTYSEKEVTKTISTNTTNPFEGKQEHSNNETVFVDDNLSNQASRKSDDKEIHITSIKRMEATMNATMGKMQKLLSRARRSISDSEIQPESTNGINSYNDLQVQSVSKPKINMTFTLKEMRKLLNKVNATFTEFKANQAESLNTTSTMDKMRKLIKAYWNGERRLTLSAHARNMVKAILNLLHTDSPKYLEEYFSFTHKYAVGVILMEENPGFCAQSALVNASVQYERTKDERKLVGAIQIYHSLRYTMCITLAIDALSSIGCKKLPQSNTTGIGRCYKQGKIYDVEGALKHYGGHLPYPIPELILPLYYSESYADNLMASAMLSSVVKGSSSGVINDMRSLTEVLKASIEPTGNKCSCKNKRERFISVCTDFADADISHILNEFTTECPPEASYLK